MRPAAPGGWLPHDIVPSPNIWRWPQLYEVENRAQDATGSLWSALTRACPLDCRDVVDVGCGDGFHLRRFAERARSVVGVEPHPPLVKRARRRVAGLAGVRVVHAGAAELPLPDASADLVHARTAYFFGPGCEPGLAQAQRVLRPGGAIAIVDLDATAAPYGDWLRADAPRYDPVAAERFFAGAGFSLLRVPAVWRFTDRDALESVLRIEFSAAVAQRAIDATSGLVLSVGYRLHVRRKQLR